MVVILRVIKGWGAGLGIGLLNSLKIHVLPISIGAELYFAGHGVHA